MPIHYPTTTGSLYTVNSRSMKRKRLDAQVAVKLQGGCEALFGDVGYQNQVEVVQIAAQSAYNGFNRVDQVSGFRGVMSVALRYGPGGIMVDGSSSSGLAYGLSLFLTWWRAKAKPQPALPTIITTGTLSRLGEVSPIEGMAAKLQGTLSFLEQQDDEINSVFICHPDNAQEINPETRAELNALHCDIVEATSLGDALKALLSDWYDGDGISEPFKGLDSFEYVDQQRFFGREQDVEALIKALNKSNGSLVVAGASGSGKSSLLKAGVIPTLERTDKGCVATFSTPQDIGEDIESWLKSLPDTSDERHLIIIDQAESLFRGIAGDANEWLDNLQSYLNKHPNTQLIISIRDEFIAALSKHNAFSEMQLFTVPAELSHQQWYTIITKQAEYANLSFEEGLIDELMTVAMERRDNLPLMSFLLQQMHAHSDKHTRTITFKDYDAVGKLEGVIDTQAEKAIRKFDEDTLKQWLPILFLHLIWVNEDDSSRLSRPYEVTEQTPPNINALIQALYEEKLLKRISKEKPIYQIAHERLMTSWKRIEDWLKEDKAFALWRQKVTKQAKEWEAKKRPNDLLLGRGLPVNVAKDAMEKHFFELEQAQDSAIFEYIQSSVKIVRLRNNVLIFSIVSIILFLASSWVYSYNKQQQYKNELIINLDKESELASNSVRKLIADGENSRALDLAISVLPKSDKDERPLNPKAMNAAVLAGNIQDILAFLPLRENDRVLNYHFNEGASEIIAVGRENQVYVWSANSFKEIYFHKFKSEVVDAFILKSGKYAIVENDRVTIVNDNNLVGTHGISKCENVIQAILTLDMNLFLTCQNGSLIKWSINSTSIIAHAETNLDDPVTVISPSNNRVLVYSRRSGKVYVYLNDRLENVAINSVPITQRAPVFVRTQIKFLYDGIYMSYGSDRYLYLWEVDTGQLINRIKNDSLVTHAVYSKVGDYFVTGTYSGKINLWRLDRGVTKHLNQMSTSSSVTGLRLISSAREIIVSDLAGNIYVQSLDVGEKIQKIFKSISVRDSIQFSESSNLILSSFNNHYQSMLILTKRKNTLPVTLTTMKSGLRDFIVNPVAFVAALSTEKSVEFFDSRNGYPLFYDSYADGVSFLAYSNSKIFVATSNKIYVYDLKGNLDWSEILESKKLFEFDGTVSSFSEFENGYMKVNFSDSDDFGYIKTNSEIITNFKVSVECFDYEFCVNNQIVENGPYYFRKLKDGSFDVYSKDNFEVLFNTSSDWIGRPSYFVYVRNEEAINLVLEGTEGIKIYPELKDLTMIELQEKLPVNFQVYKRVNSITSDYDGERAKSILIKHGVNSFAKPVPKQLGKEDFDANLPIGYIEEDHLEKLN